MRGVAGRLLIVLKIPSVRHPRDGGVNLTVGFLRRTDRGLSDSRVPAVSCARGTGTYFVLSQWFV